MFLLRRTEHSQCIQKRWISRLNGSTSWQWPSFSLPDPNLAPCWPPGETQLTVTMVRAYHHIPFRGSWICAPIPEPRSKQREAQSLWGWGWGWFVLRPVSRVKGSYSSKAQDHTRTKQLTFSFATNEAHLKVLFTSNISWVNSSLLRNEGFQSCWMSQISVWAETSENKNITDIFNIHSWPEIEIIKWSAFHDHVILYESLHSLHKKSVWGCFKKLVEKEIKR